VWLGYLALLGRPVAANGSGGTMEWYPIGRLVLWAAILGTLVIAVAVLNFGTDKSIPDRAAQCIRTGAAGAGPEADPRPRRCASDHRDLGDGAAAGRGGPVDDPQYVQSLAGRPHRECVGTIAPTLARSVRNDASKYDARSTGCCDCGLFLRICSGCCQACSPQACSWPIRSWGLPFCAIARHGQSRLALVGAYVAGSSSVTDPGESLLGLPKPPSTSRPFIPAAGHHHSNLIDSISIRRHHEVILSNGSPASQMGDAARQRRFARNFLLPKGGAARRKDNRSRFEAMKAELGAQPGRGETEKVAQATTKFAVLPARSRQLYGSVTPRDVATL
jgi:hypothetical protein